MRNIRWLLCDVDGILTDASVFVGGAEEIKRFNIQDGLGLVALRRQGVKVGWISSRPSPATARRARELKIDFLRQERGSKVRVVESLLEGAKQVEACRSRKRGLKRRMNQNPDFCRWAVPLVLVLALALCPRPGRAQPVVGGQGFKFAEYYEPPHDRQMKSLLEGERAQRQPDGQIQVTGAKWQTFRQNGAGELVVEAPECTYDPSQRTISSAGSLRMQTADQRFSIAGQGFLWQQTNSTLLVSNRVHTIIHPGLLGRQSAPATTNTAAETSAGIDVFADQFEYAEELGQGIYSGNVRVAGTNLAATAGKLTILLPVAERRLRSLLAEQNVVVDYEKIHATGERAFYSADTDLIELTGQPTWRIEQREGGGDELVFDRTNRLFRAKGHARLSMPAQSLGAPGLLSQPGTASAQSLPADHLVEILADNYELRTNIAIFRQDVRVSDRLGPQQQGELRCGLMTVTLAGTNELERIVAENQVFIGQGDRQFTADKAEYTGTNGVLDLIGNPAWRDGPREGKGDVMRVHLAREEMLVLGNAVMKLPATELGQSAFTAAGAPKRGETKAVTHTFAEIYSRDYFVAPQSALFQGGVRIEHPQMRWTCEEITLLSPPEMGKDGRIILAEPAVVFDVEDDEGRSFRGTGDKAVYTHFITAARTNDTVELTGKPATVTATNLLGRNNLIVLDLASHKLMAPGRYRLWGTAPAGAAPTWQLPQSPLRR